ncbi:MAG: CocE/NonD family hydrolase [Hyphomonadaceae bacterium]|nr:CocE/NonD family hydrolase [Hyphomonadaceae bacterium]MBC6412399.1 CocE/NonD family hydrolase [Hyphomonadaceae bacterium]
MKQLTRRAGRLLFGLLFGITLSTGGAVAQSFPNYLGEFPDGVKTTYDFGVEMRDGVELATDIYVPAGDGPFPTLLVRDIYSDGSTELRQSYAKFATANGYAFVFQAARGRHDSDGEWYPYFQEIEDGDDTLTWIAAQPWSDGKVGMFGSSYLASVQWLAALNGNPALVAIAPAMSPGNYYRDVAYPGGAFSLLSRASWGLGLVGTRTNTSYPVDWVGNIDHLPLNTLGPTLGFNVKHFQDWLEHPSYDDYWKPLNLEGRASEMGVPALNIGGWYDVFLRSTIGSYTTMSREAATVEAREGQRLIIGPWPHGWNRSRQNADVDFGADSLIDVERLLLEWFDYWMKDGEEPDMAPVRIFVMGENRWRDEQEWPLARTQYRPYYLHADGALSTEKPTSQSGKQSYVYDPAKPVPTLGGNIMEATLRGPHDQGPLDARTDILRFSTQPFDQPVEITGPVSAELYAASSAKDTDFMAKLIVEKADGSALNLVDGVIRARYREGFEEPELLQPGKVYKYTLDLWATSYLLEPGDRLRVDITSSNFPRLARNLNTGADFAETSEMVVANQTIWMSAGHPSNIILPVVPRRPQEAVSFSGEPLLRFEIDEARLAELAKKSSGLEAKSFLSEDEYIELAGYYIDGGRYRDAIDLYTGGLDQYPDSFRLRRHRGHRYINVRELDKAIVDLQEALALMGENPQPVFQRGKDGQPHGTYEHWVWYHIGLYNYLNGDYGAAADAYQKCVDTATKNDLLIGATDWLFNSLMKDGKPAEAARVLEAVTADIEADRSRAYYKRVMVYKGLLDPDGLVDLEKPGYQWSGGDITLGYGIANWYAANGDTEKAQKIYDNILMSPWWGAWAYVVTDREQSLSAK